MIKIKALIISVLATIFTLVFGMGLIWLIFLKPHFVGGVLFVFCIFMLIGRFYQDFKDYFDD